MRSRGWAGVIGGSSWPRTTQAERYRSPPSSPSAPRQNLSPTAFGVPGSHVTLVTGAASRDKVIEIAGPAGPLARRLQEMLGP
jgi:hypothetical protein